MTLTAERSQTSATSLERTEDARDGGRHYWLTVNGETVSFAKVYANDASLCDIETREGHRHRGHATALLRLIGEDLGVTQITHHGGYTPDGFAYIRHHLKDREPQTKPTYVPMYFVEDWRARTTAYL